MANIKDLKKRIRSTKGTFKITKAMKLVSAAKMSRAQGKALSFRPYANELESTIKTVSALNADYTSAYFKENAENKNAIVLVISSDKGLCGSYNTSVAKLVKKFKSEHSDESLKFCFIGKKARDLVKKDVLEGKTFTFKKAEPSYDEIRALAGDLANQFLIGEVGKVYLIHNTFLSAIAFDSMAKQVLPMVVTEAEKTQLKESYPYDYKYEPSAESILDTLVPETFVTSVYSAVLDAIASEHAARMSAMENASKNCKEMIRKLTLKMNKLRQAKITTELIEVVSGAESLNG